ncbi:MAG TPA: DmsC/YnfH family molybdoenzyme membrane anchor subunit [Vicinamibacterales bacterium]|jgi:anaerobic dimethyl sulfoxide reductase subunit C (anchor subunit)
MSADARPSEWPLIVFTLGVQFACAVLLAAVTADVLTGANHAGAARPLGVMVFPSIAGAILCSWFHLGRPRDAWKSLSNLAHSRLSQEVLLTGLFVAAALPYSAMWYGGITALRPAWGIATAMLGLAAIASGASIYTVPARPVWNSWWVPASFFGATLVLAGPAFAIVVNASGLRTVLDVLLAATIVGSVLQLVSAFGMLTVATAVAGRQARDAGIEEAPALNGAAQRRTFALHLILACVLPAAVAVWLSTVGREDAGAVNRGIVALAFLSAATGATLGRRLMFTLGTSIPRF